MRSLLVAISLMVASVASSAMTGCAAPSVGSLGGDRDLPEREDDDEDFDAKEDEDDDDDSTRKPGSGSTTSNATASKQTLTVASTGDGTGDITSDPPGVTCTGGSCTGDFAAGTKVTLTATPKAGSIFAGFTGGGCTGATCTTTIANAATVSAQFITLAGTWSGTYSHSQQGGNGCTFKNQGTLENTMAGTDSFTTAAKATGFELRNGNCALVQTSNGSAGPSAATVSGNKITGTWNMAIQNAGNGALPLPFEATIIGNKMSGKWTCSGCTGEFNVSK